MLTRPLLLSLILAACDPGSTVDHREDAEIKQLQAKVELLRTDNDLLRSRMRRLAMCLQYPGFDGMDRCAEHWRLEEKP